MGFIKGVLSHAKAAVGAVLLSGMLVSMAGCTIQIGPANSQPDAQAAPPAPGAWDSPVASGVLASPTDQPAASPTLQPVKNPTGFPVAGYMPEQLKEYVERELFAPKSYSAEYGLDTATFGDMWLVCDTYHYMLRTGKPMVELESPEKDGSGTYLIPIDEVKKMAKYQYGNDSMNVSWMDSYRAWLDGDEGFVHGCAHDGKLGLGIAQRLRSYCDIGQGQIEVVVDHYTVEPEDIPDERGILGTWDWAQKCILQPVDMEGQLLFTLLYSEQVGAA